jgi:hypothetical protein
MSGGGGGPTRLLGRLATTLLVLAIAGEVLVGVLPRLVLPILLLAAAFVVVRWTIFHTRRW